MTDKALSGYLTCTTAMDPLTAPVRPGLVWPLRRVSSARQSSRAIRDYGSGGALTVCSPPPALRGGLQG